MATARPARFWVPPGLAADESHLLQNLLGFELDVYDRFVDWKDRVAQAPIGSSVLAPLPVLLRSDRTVPLSEIRRLGGPVVNRGYPLAGRPPTTPPLLFREEAGLPEEGRPVLIEQLRVLAIPTGARHSTIFERALAIESWRAVDLKEFLPPLPSSSAVRDVVPAVLDGFKDARSAVDGSLRGLAGSPALPGQGAGLDVTVGAPRVDSQTAGEALRVLAAFRPPWEPALRGGHSRRIWAGDSRFGPIYRPYEVAFATDGAGGVTLGHPDGHDRSAIVAGPAAGGHLLRMLFSGDYPVIRTSEEIESLADSTVDPETVAPMLSLAMYAHAIDPYEGDRATLERARRRSIEEMAESSALLLRAAGLPGKEVEKYQRLSDGFRESVRRAASAYARLALRRTVLPDDYLGVSRAFADSIANVTSSGNPRDMLPYLDGWSSDVSAANRRREVAIQSYLLVQRRATVEEIWAAVGSTDLWESERDLSGYLDVLRERGRIIVNRDLSLEWVD